MKPQFSVLAALCTITLAMLACSSSFQVVETPSSVPDQSNIPTEVLMTDEPANLLPHTLYYLGDDTAGLTQVFRMERDGHTLHQVTAEAENVTDFDVSRQTGRVVYQVNNQLFQIESDGSNRQLLADGGPLDPNDPFTRGPSHPAISPDGQMIAYSDHGLILYSVANSTSARVLEGAEIDSVTGTTIPAPDYLPEKFSPDGSQLLITIAVPRSDAIIGANYVLATNTLISFTGGETGPLCCGQPQWTLDSSALYAGNPTAGLFATGLWKVDANNGNITTLLPMDAGNENFNLAAEPFLAGDGQLYYFYTAAAVNPNTVQRPSLQIVRSAPDGQTGRVVLNANDFALMNEALWAPDASLVIVVYSLSPEVYGPGRAELTYLDGRPGVLLSNFASHLTWGP